PPCKRGGQEYCYFVLNWYHILHHSQSAFYGRALLPIPQENSFFVERASTPLLTLVQDIRFHPR
ncbi:hypothetical protein QT971_20570, partial [Microcoleus sp. herbarium19]